MAVGAVAAVAVVLEAAAPTSAADLPVDTPVVDQVAD
jgi:hypothetical protein